MACVRDSPNGTQRTLNDSRLPIETVGANVTIGGNVGTSGTIGKPNGVNSNIMINIFNLILYSYFLGVDYSTNALSLVLLE